MSKARKILPGLWFAVPLRNSGYALGRVARVGRGGVLLGYFFGPRLSSLSEAVDIKAPSSREALLVARFGDPGLTKGSWPTLAIPSPPWNEGDWPLPAFARTSEAPRRSWRVEYNSSDLTSLDSETPCAQEDVEGLPPDGLLGYGAVEIVLTKLLDQLPPLPSSAADGREHYLYFRDQEAAMRAGADLKLRGISSTVRSAADEDCWLLLAVLADRGEPTADEEQLMEELAERYSGEYDGWEATA